MAGLFDFSGTDSPKQGTLGNMSPQQMGLLQAGLSMLAAPKYAPIGNGLVRSTGFGEQVAPGIANGLNAMQQQQSFLQEQKAAQLKQLREQEAYDTKKQYLSSIANIDPTDKKALLKLAMQSGASIKDIIELQKQPRDGIPSGYNVNEQGQLAPMPLSNGGSYEDVLLNRQIAGAQGRANIVDPMEQARLNIALQGVDLQKQKFDYEKQKDMTPKPLSDFQQYQIDMNNKEKEKLKSQSELSTQDALDTAEKLYNHPGREAATGASSFLSVLPGTKAKSFQTDLDTFTSQTFVPMVQALKGMGALSDAEGKKLTASVGALDPNMDEQDFTNSLKHITGYLYKKATASGLNVTLPTFADESGKTKRPQGASGDWSGSKPAYKLSPETMMKDKETRAQIQSIIDSGDPNDIAEAKKRGLIKE
jgi:hypothetical protein